MAVTLEEITGVFNREIVRFDEDALVADLADGTKLKGKAPEGDLIPGVPYKFFGKWETHPRHGKQFAFRQYLKTEPHTKYGVVKYLQHSAPHVGPAIAGRLFDAFKQDAVKILRTDPERAASTIKGLTVENAREAAVVLQAQSALEETKIDLMDLFATRGFPHSLVNTVLKKWGIHAPLRIRRDPFSLLVEGFGGCGFARCDRLYTDLGLPLDRLKRQMICLWHAIQEDSSGHTWHSLELIKGKMRRMVAGVSVDPNKAIKLGVRAKWLSIRKDEAGRWWIATAEKADSEKDLADAIRELQEWAPLAVQVPEMAGVE